MNLKAVFWVFFVVLLILVSVDMTRVPSQQATAKVLLRGIDFYQAHLSAHTFSHCKFTPTCSQYARLAIQKYGAFKGTGKAIWRVLRCSPFTSARGEDYP